ncbi:MAG: aminotransferase class V-fold PLP-dependent enzyme [Halieaceae bacterium]
MATHSDYSDLFAASPGIYLLNHSVGRPPANTWEALQRRFYEPWEQGASEPWPAWLAAIDEFRGALARLLNADIEELCPQVNLSSALTKVLGALPRDPQRPCILLNQHDFPSLGFVAERAAVLGYQLRFLPVDEDVADPAVWEQAMDEQVAVVLLTQVQSNNGVQLPVAELAALARARGIVSVVDIAQSVGVIPIDLQQMQPDFVVGSCVKWLCGGPGAGFLWVASDMLARCQPMDVGWFSHQAPFEFDIRDFRYADSALRFWGGTPSVAPYLLAANSIELMLKIGVETIRAHNLALTDALLQAVATDHVVNPHPAEGRGGTLVLALGESQARFVEKLQAAEVAFDSRSSGLRLSPHIYNTAEQISRVIDCLP